MKKKVIIIVSLIIASLIIWLGWINNSFLQKAKSNTNLKDGAEVQLDNLSAPQVKDSSGNASKSYILKQTNKVTEDNLLLIQPQLYFSRFVTPSTKLKITNTEGKLLYESSPQNPFVNLKSVKGGDFIAVNRGDGRFRLINTTNSQFVDLPATPPVLNPVGFNWEWLDRQTLIGVAGIGFDEKANNNERCCDEHIIKNSLVYLYRPSLGKLEPVQIPSEIASTPFSLGRITREGFIELISISGHNNDGQSLGWYKIESND